VKISHSETTTYIFWVFIGVCRLVFRSLVENLLLIISFFKKGLYGFPSELENPDIFEPATLSRKKDKHEEERRFFYFAVTRAMNNLIIYTQKDSIVNSYMKLKTKLLSVNLSDAN